jgi:hypothetical protein
VLILGEFAGKKWYIRQNASAPFWILHVETDAACSNRCENLYPPLDPFANQSSNVYQRTRPTVDDNDGQKSGETEQTQSRRAR